MQLDMIILYGAFAVGCLIVLNKLIAFISNNKDLQKFFAWASNKLDNKKKGDDY